MKNVTQHKKSEKTKCKTNLSQRDLHKYVRSIEINLEDFLQIIIQIPCIRSFIKSEILLLK